MKFIFSKEHINKVTGQKNIIPGCLADTFNSAFVNLRDHDRSIIALSDSIRETEYMVRLTQAGHKEATYRGKEAREIVPDLRPGIPYVENSSGFGPSGHAHIDIGISRRGTSESAEQYHALSLAVDYSDKEWVKVECELKNIGPRKFGLGLSGPETTEQMNETLRIIGGTIDDIEKGKAVDFEILRQRFIDEAGLKPEQEMTAELKNGFVGNSSAPLLRPERLYRLS